MERPRVSDWLRNEQRFVQEMAQRACAAMQEGAVTIREAHERIKHLERENKELREKLG